MPSKRSGNILISLPVIAGAVAALLMAGCAAPSAAPPSPAPAAPRPAGTSVPAAKPTTQIEKILAAASTRGTHDTAFYVGLAKGIFKEEGVDLQVQLMKADVAVAALISGEVEFNTAASTILQAAARGAPVRQVMAVRGKPAWHVMTKSDIRSVQDLKGKKIGVGTARSAPQFAMMKILQKNGLDPNKDAIFLGLGGVTSTRLGALRAGSVDALLETAPQHALLKKEGFNELMKVADGVPEWPVGSLSTGTKQIRDRPDMVKRMIRATLKSMIFVKQNKADTVDILMKELAELGMDRDSMAASYDDTVDQFMMDGMMSDQGLVIEFASMKEFGEKVEVPKAADLVDYSLLQEVLKELKLR
ncbi:MAG: ABC transporter substrate-binding protein [Chloroflexi bacterium]|nr:ABC transporter substrate-binding protein [Chloroflexota bacterium]